jgi:hypothetical protein
LKFEAVRRYFVHLALCGTEALEFATRELGLQVNADKTNYMFMSRGRSQCEKIDIRPIESVEDFIYFGTTLTNKTSIQEEIKRTFNSGNVCYYSCRISCLTVSYPKI